MLQWTPADSQTIVKYNANVSFKHVELLQRRTTRKKSLKSRKTDWLSKSISKVQQELVSKVYTVKIKWNGKGALKFLGVFYRA